MIELYCCTCGTVLAILLFQIKGAEVLTLSAHRDFTLQIASSVLVQTYICL